MLTEPINTREWLCVSAAKARERSAGKLTPDIVWILFNEVLVTLLLDQSWLSVTHRAFNKSLCAQPQSLVYVSNEWLFVV